MKYISRFVDEIKMDISYEFRKKLWGNITSKVDHEIYTKLFHPLDRQINNVSYKIFGSDE